MDINHIVSWTEDSLLKLHPDKMENERWFMRICFKNSQILAFDYTLESTGDNITRVSEEKDLGITIDDKLSFDQHINESSTPRAQQDPWNHQKKLLTYQY